MANRTLLEHAAYELTKAGLTNNDDPNARKTASDVMALLKRFLKQEHTPNTGPYVLEYFEVLAQFLPLTPITDDPDEWDKFEVDRKNIDTEEVEKKIVWQSKRASSLFSEDEGKTFKDQRTGQVGESLDHIKQAEEQAKAEEERKARKKAAEDRAKDPAPVASDTSAPAEEVGLDNGPVESEDAATPPAADQVETPPAPKKKPAKKTETK